MLQCYRDLLRLRRSHAEFTDPWLPTLGVDYDPDEQWIMLHRNTFRLVCNLSPEPVTVPYGGRPVLWWEPPGTDETHSATVVPGHSFVVLDVQVK